MTADLRRMIEHSHENRPPASVIDDLRVNGKYPVRGYKVFTAGRDQPTPEGIRVLQGMKSNRNWMPSQSELDRGRGRLPAVHGQDRRRIVMNEPRVLSRCTHRW